MPDADTAGRLTQLISGYWISQAVYAAAKLGIADLLRDGPRTVDELAAASQTRAPLLYRLLRALAGAGLFAEQAPGTFALTPTAELLRSDVAGSQRSLALMMGEEHYVVWGKLIDVLRHGGNAFEQLHGMPVFDYLAQHPDKGRIFDEAMVGIHGRETAAVLEAYDFSVFKTLVDVGGGNGSQLAALLACHTALGGVLFDLPHVVERAASMPALAGLAARCELRGGDFFRAVPEGGDAYLLRHIIHDWTDEQALVILENCARAMRPGTKLLLIEAVIPPGNEPFATKFLDLTMMLIPGGQERTADEYARLFDRSGFDLLRIVPTATEISVLEGVRRDG